MAEFLTVEALTIVDERREIGDGGTDRGTTSTLRSGSVQEVESELPGTRERE